jgi:hypothetical protein
MGDGERRWRTTWRAPDVTTKAWISSTPYAAHGCASAPPHGASHAQLHASTGIPGDVVLRSIQTGVLEAGGASELIRNISADSIPASRYVVHFDRPPPARRTARPSFLASASSILGQSGCQQWKRGRGPRALPRQSRVRLGSRRSGGGWIRDYGHTRCTLVQ